MNVLLLKLRGYLLLLILPSDPQHVDWFSIFLRKILLGLLNLQPLTLFWYLLQQFPFRFLFSFKSRTPNLLKFLITCLI